MVNINIKVPLHVKPESIPFCFKKVEKSFVHLAERVLQIIVITFTLYFH